MWVPTLCVCGQITSTLWSFSFHLYQVCVCWGGGINNCSSHAAGLLRGPWEDTAP